MAALLKNGTSIERRDTQHDQDLLWDQLTLAQKFSASNLMQFGYKLSFIRSHNEGDTAVLLCDGNTATIGRDGEIDSQPSINVRD